MVNEKDKQDFGKGDGSRYEEYFKRINNGKSTEEEKEKNLKFFSDLIDSAEEDE